MRKVLLLAGLLILISACAPARSQTATANPVTATPTSTGTPTAAPSLTPSPTLPPTITPTPSPADKAWLARVSSTLLALRRPPANYSEAWVLREGASISPDGHWLASLVWDAAYPLNDGELAVTSLIGPQTVFREHIERPNVGRALSSGAWSPDSRRFIVFRSSYLGDQACPGDLDALVTIQATGIKVTHGGAPWSCPWVIWSPDGHDLLFITKPDSGSTEMWLMDASSGAMSEKAHWSLGSLLAMPLGWTYDGFYYEACMDGDWWDCSTAKLMQMDTTTWSVRAVRDLPGYVSPVTLGVLDKESNSVFVMSNKDVRSYSGFESPPHHIIRLSLDSLQADARTDLPPGLLTGENATSTGPGAYAAFIIDAKLWIFNSADGSLTAHGAAYDVIGWFSNISGFLVNAQQIEGQPSPPELRIVRP